MSRIVIAFLFVLSLAPQGLLAAGQLTQVVISKQTPDPNSCTAPPAATSFSTTDQAVWLWFYVSNVSVGDDYSVAFYTPAGTMSGTPSDFGPETVPGSWCYAVSLGIAGYAPANLPGAWNAYIYNKGSQIYRQPFTITGSTTCTYSLSATSANVAAAGGSGSFTVTVTAGCTATVSTDAPTWITLSVSGSTVNYTVQANTGTSSRIGHITVGTQTFTVTQAGASVACSYSLSSSSANVVAGGGSGSFTVSVTAGTGCSWTASPDVTWITGSVSGSTVSYTVAANTSTSSRTGHITVGTQTFTVTQAGASGGGTTSGNLIVNGDAESGPAVRHSGTATSIPGWTTDGMLTVEAYTDTSGQLSDWSHPSSFGNNYFSGGSSASATMTQTINLSSYASAIDAGGQGYTLDGWLGGVFSMPDNAALQVTFLSASGGTLGTASIGPVLAADRGNVTELLERTATGTVPSGTRSALIRLTITALSTYSLYNDGCADNLSFVLGGGGGSTSTGNFTFPGFANTAGLTLVGSAAIASTSDGTVLRLTPATGNQSGAAYSTTPVTLGNNATFSTQFQFKFGSQGGSDPADGITFLLGTSANGLGGLGVGIGYAGVGGKSVAIEFDTYNNGSGDGNSSNHVAIDTNGNLTNTNLANVYGKATCDFSSGTPNTAAGCMSNGDLWTVNINYDGSNLTVTLSDPKEGSSFTAINNYPINLASLLGQTTAYVGFTAGTGAGWETHDIVNWTFHNTAQSTGCTYSLVTSSASAGVGAGSGSFTVTTGTGCTLSAAAADVTWITPAVSGPSVNYTVQANTSTSSRTGHITVNGQTFTVTQVGTGAAAGYWQYIKTDSGIQPYAAGGAYPDTYSGAEGNFSVTITERVAAGYPVPTLGANFTWSRPPITLIPGTALSWPVSAKLTANANTGAPYLGFSFSANSYPYLPVSNLATVSPWATYYLIQLNIDWTSPVGTVVTYDNALQKSPTLIPPGTTTWMDANGQMTLLTHIRGSSDYYWSYVYQWVPGDTGPSCTYSLATSSASAVAGAGSGSFAVTTGTGCTLSAAAADVTWITPTVSGTTVNYTVQANTSTSSRTGHITVNGQTFTVTQAGAAPCTYTITPTSNNMTAQGGSSSITVTVTGGGSCSWSASVSSSASSWLHLGSTTSGTTSGSVAYTADANTSTVSRTGTIAIASATFTLTQAGGSSATAPNINQGGIVNAVSNRGGGGIAQGSMFTIYGSNLGPTVGWTAYQFPLPDHLDPGNVTVSVTQGSTTLKAYLLFVRADQINAIMPSSVRLGDAQVTVTYNGIIGASATVTIVKVAFGMNSANYGTGPGIIQNYNTATDHPFNGPSTPAKPRQVEIIVGTGLGAITTPDNVSPPAGAPTTPVQVVVGGIPADVAYSGRAPGNAGQDQINFTVPANAPLGCHVPVQVSAGGIWSNAVSMAISADGKQCQDSFSPFGNVSSTGGNAGTIGLIRLKFNGQSTKTGGPINAAFDLGIGAFVKNSPGGDLAYSPLTNLPPPGACSSTSTKADQGTLTSNIFGIDPTIASTLDAGAQLTVTGGAGGASGTMTQSLGTANPYAGLLGGILNISSSMTMPPPFLDGGPFTVSGPGGKDVGPFTTNIALTPAITWTNPPSTINRASPLTLTWTGGDSTEVVVIGGSSTDQTSKAYGGFTCVAPAGAHSFTVPVNTLADLIPVGVATSSTGAFGMLLLMPLEPGSMQFTPLPTGLKVGVVFDTTATMQQVLVQ